MLTRVVKLSIQPHMVESFMKIFHENKMTILNAQGLNNLDLFADQNDGTIMFTISHWENEECIQMYRDSEYFRNLWSQLKPLFNNKAEAWTLNPL
jgi:quinol monooxygenase YgiN